MSAPHTQFPPRLPDVPAQRPQTVPALLQFLQDPQSPWTQATQSGGGFAYDDVVARWLVPVLERVFTSLDKEGDGVRGLLEELTRREQGGRGWALLGVWTLAGYLSPPASEGTTTTTTTTTTTMDPALVLDLIRRVVRDLEEGEVRLGGVVDTKHGVIVRQLAIGILEFGKTHAVVHQLLPVLETLLVKYRPEPSSLTVVHALFLEACLATRNLVAGKALADVPIWDVTRSPLTYMDYLGYHYLAGMVYIGLKEWDKAREMLVTAVTMPGSSVSAVQIAAHKKLVLVDLIISGEAPQYGKMISGQVNAAFGLHAAEYTALGQAYRELNYGALKRLLENKTEVFRQDMNYGLLLSVYEAIPARRLINLRETYVKMDMEKLASEISVGSFTELTPHEAEELVVKLVREGKLHARIERPQGTTVAQVSFIDDAEPFNTSTTVDRIGVEMKSVQDVTGKLVGLEQAWSMHEGWLKEVLRKEKDKSRAFNGTTTAGGGGGGPPGRGEQDADIRAAVVAAGLGGGNVRGVGANWADEGF